MSLHDDLFAHIYRQMDIEWEKYWREKTGAIIQGGKIVPGAIGSGTIPAAALPAHHSTHEVGGTDALTGPLDANARVAISLNGVLMGTRRDVNLIEGPGVAVTVADNPGSERVDVTITATGGGSGGSAPELLVSGDPPEAVTADGDFIYVTY